MSTLSPFLVFEKTCNQVLTLVNEKLTGSGFRTVQTFNLQTARLAHLECQCPHHGTSDCNCQMLVLLVYGKQEDPATLIIHSQGEKTGVSLSGPGGDHAAQNLGSTIRRVLVSQSSYALTPQEVPHEHRAAL
jgi:hypothetical protein